MTTSLSTLRSMLFEALDLLDSVQDQLVSVDRMHVERLKEISGWERQKVASGKPTPEYADVFQPRPGLLKLIVQGANMQAAE